MPQLDQAIWDGASLRPEVARSLEKVAEIFLAKLGVDGSGIVPIDVLLVGSMAGFNYTDASDIDLHVLVDSDDVSKDPEMAQAYFRARAAAWNLKHKVTVRGRPVEVYAQTVGEHLDSRAVYSVLRGEWVKVQDPATAEITREAAARAKSIAADWASLARRLIAGGGKDGAQSAIEAIYHIRRDGLEESGETGAGNIAFKIVRGMGLLGALKDFVVRKEDEELSVKE